MPSKKFSPAFTTLMAISAAILLTMATPARAQTETVLHNFANTGADGYQTYSGLIVDAAGNLYGSTLEGGRHKNCYGENIGCGTVFELSPATGGGWTETILHDFNLDGIDGANPSGTLIFDAAGNLYGTTSHGGKGTCSPSNSCGTVFELMPKAGGGWTERILHNFGSSSTDGSFPAAGLIFDKAGNLYGTTTSGGGFNFETVFQMKPASGGGWNEHVLHSFDGKDGSSPLASLIMDSAGNLYGTAWTGGGNRQAGTVFELMPSTSGSWPGKVLHFFRGPDGVGPYGGLAMDAVGNLFGTTQSGGANHHGTIFELTLGGGGNWTQTILHNFDNNGTDGYEPLAAPTFDGKGNLFGTTEAGGTGACARTGCGTVYELSPATGGGWTESVFYNFPSYASGYWPASGLIFDAAGNLYGTTLNGGTDSGCVCGTAFELTP